MYSINDMFRKKWLPNALTYEIALGKLKRYQEHTGLPITLHWAFIQGENDKREDVLKLAQVVRKYELMGKFNLVRYNPPRGIKETYEPHMEILKEYLDIMKTALTKSDRSKIVSAVGRDVYASCGTFISDSL
jgi:adenine C2-methylase RlmN of 23S rRNA A2503 and tRNA A37